MIVLEIIRSILEIPTFVTRSFLLMFVFGLIFMLTRGKKA